jgi:m7GpppX diphosphatase
MTRKWDGKTISSLYLCAILHRHDLSSIRDLNEFHIPLLEKIQHKVIDATTAKWPKVRADQLRMYFHCRSFPLTGLTVDHPSYYHLHIHIVHTDYQGSDGMAVGKAWLLDNIIEELPHLGPEGFKRKTITVIVGEESDLWKKVYSKLS